MNHGQPLLQLWRWLDPCCSFIIIGLHGALLLQVALEGAVNAKLAASSLARGELPQGDPMDHWPAVPGAHNPSTALVC